MKAGVVDNGVFSSTKEGVPQGGVISPLLANIALHGLETYLNEFVADRSVKGRGRRSKIQQLAVIRYADDFVIIHPEYEVILECKRLIQKWLKLRGLALHAEKTKITYTMKEPVKGFPYSNRGFDFLGFTILQRKIGRFRIKNSKLKLNMCTHICPSKKSMTLYKDNLRELFKDLGQTAEALLAKLNPKIKG